MTEGLTLRLRGLLESLASGEAGIDSASSVKDLRFGPCGGDVLGGLLAFRAACSAKGLRDQYLCFFLLVVEAAGSAMGAPVKGLRFRVRGGDFLGASLASGATGFAMGSSPKDLSFRARGGELFVGLLAFGAASFDSGFDSSFRPRGGVLLGGMIAEVARWFIV